MWIIRKRINLPSERAIFLFVDKMVPQSRSVLNLFEVVWMNHSCPWMIFILYLRSFKYVTVYLVGQWVNCIPNIRTLTDFFTLPTLEKTLLETSRLDSNRFLWLISATFWIFKYSFCDRYHNLIQKLMLFRLGSVAQSSHVHSLRETDLTFALLRFEIVHSHTFTHIMKVLIICSCKFFIYSCISCCNSLIKDTEKQYLNFICSMWYLIHRGSFVDSYC